MKVKELIAQLQEQNPEDEIHIWVDKEVGCRAGFFDKYYASDIRVLRLEEEIKSHEDLEQEVYDEYKIIDDLKKEALIIAMEKILGTWIKIQP